MLAHQVERPGLPGHAQSPDLALRPVMVVVVVVVLRVLLHRVQELLGRLKGWKKGGASARRGLSLTDGQKKAGWLRLAAVVLPFRR